MRTLGPIFVLLLSALPLGASAAEAPLPTFSVAAESAKSDAEKDVTAVAALAAIDDAQGRVRTIQTKLGKGKAKQEAALSCVQGKANMLGSLASLSGNAKAEYDKARQAGNGVRADLLLQTILIAANGASKLYAESLECSGDVGELTGDTVVEVTDVYAEASQDVQRIVAELLGFASDPGNQSPF